ncbi:tyrosine-type recombinase/integrase [Alistipes dispar]|uniref:tyrosine-type recombinase/integrase n=1 Tax=Alistipes dispar TaxID=2585119 RepID=UPI003A85BA09
MQQGVEENSGRSRHRQDDNLSSKPPHVRHDQTTNALAQGIRIEVVSRMLGHTNIKTTQIYAKVTDDMLAKGFDEMADIYTASHDKKRNNSCLRSSVFIPSAQHIVPQSIVEPTCEQNRDGLFSHTPSFCEQTQKNTGCLSIGKTGFEYLFPVYP